MISITGGKDLTLFEVDEAATRIREEVDQDANIIVGATFDETLEGIIRVSVVATGIDNAEQMAARAKPAAGCAGGCSRARAGKSSCRPDGKAARRHRQDGRAGHASPQAPPRRRSRRRAAPRSSRSAPRSRRLPLPLRRPRRLRRQRPPPTATCRSARCRRSRRCSRSRRPSRSSMHESRAAGRLHPARAGEDAACARPGCRSSRSLPMHRPERNPPGARRGGPRASAEERACRCCSVSPMSASAGATRRPSRRSPPVPRVRPCRRCRRPRPSRRACRCRSVRLRNSARPSQCPSTRAARRRRDLIRTVGRRRCKPATGRRSSGYPRLPAAPDQLTFCNNRPRRSDIPALRDRDILLSEQRLSSASQDH